MSRHQKFSTIGRKLNDEVAEKTLYKTKRDIKSIVIHSSASPQNRGDDALTIDKWHLEKGWSGIGYHFVVLEDGTIQKGRWIDNIGAHARGFNSKSIGICRIGNVNDTTPRQMKSLLKLTRLLQEQYNIKTEQVCGHKELLNVSKLCPGMDMYIFRRELDKLLLND